MSANEKPLVTIAIPTYNRANRFLRQSIQSAVDQTYKNLEIIVSDNCSTDHTQSLVASFDDPRIRYFRQPENIGANNNFNYCINEARGLYFLLLPDDDLIDYDFIEACITSLKGDYEVGVVFAGNRVIDKNKRVLHESPNICAGMSLQPEAFFTYWFEGRISLYLCSTLFNTDQLRKSGGLHSKRNLFQDVVAQATLSWQNGRADLFEIKSSFRRYDGNAGGKPESVEAWCDDSVFLLELLCRLAGDGKAFRKKGIKYFANKNYRLAGTIPTLYKRFQSYIMIYRRYNYAYSPFRYYYNLKIKPFEDKIKRRIKSFLSLVRS